jgi:glycosyltransferase involved in cell wall biosynthesis
MTALAARHRRSLGYRLYYEHEQRWTGTTLLSRLDHYLVRQHGIRPLVAEADLVNVCTPAARAFLERHFPRSRGKTEFVPLGADPDFFSYRGDEVRRRERERLGVPENGRLLITSGKLLPHKRHDLLLRDFFALRAEVPLTLLILGAGSPSLEAALRSRAGASSRPDRRVLFEPFASRQRLPDYYSAADLGVWTTATISIVEALACELPLVLPVSESTDHLLDGNGVSYSANGFGRAVEPILADPAGLAAMRRRGAELFRERYDYRAIAATVRERYERLLASDRDEAGR